MNSNIHTLHRNENWKSTRTRKVQNKTKGAELGLWTWFNFICMVWLPPPALGWWRRCCTSLPHFPSLCFLALSPPYLTLIVLFNYGAHTLPLQFDALPPIPGTKYRLGYHRSSISSNKLNTELSPPTTALFLKLPWVRSFSINFLISQIIGKKIKKRLIIIIWFQIMLLWTLPEVEDLGVRMWIKVDFPFPLFPSNLLSWKSIVILFCLILYIPLIPADWTVNTKVDMRFNVRNAHWLSDRVREKIMQTVCHN